ncbi:MAG TPA: hypothetical protein VGG10_07985 [Rhizomicrobium sp.]|jgi:hypothetical protein
MLKPTTTPPEERLKEFEATGWLAAIITMVISFVCLMIIGGNESAGAAGAFIIASTIVSGWLGAFVFVPLLSWIAHLSLREAASGIARPEQNPEKFEMVLAKLWENQMAINLFSGLFQVCFCVGAYKIIAPRLGWL